MTNCIYTTDGLHADPPWRCSECNHEQSVTQALRRNCGIIGPVNPKAYLETAVASDVDKGLSNVTPEEAARRIECCVECPALVNQACMELFHASGECWEKAKLFQVRRLLGRWTPCERMNEVDS